MTEAEFETRVRTVEALSRQNPRRYRAGLMAWVGLGYAAFVGLLLLVLVAGILGVLLLAFGDQFRTMAGGIYLLAPVVLTLWALAPLVLSRAPRPNGRTITRSEAPALFQAIDEIRIALDAPAPDSVLVTADVNASVVEAPVIGIVPWYHRHLMLGLPLMRTLEPEELRAVLAHEFGHLSRSHAATEGRLYQLRRAWIHVAHTMPSSGRGWAARRFLQWYLPRFSAWTFVGSRRNEDEADAASARLFGEQAIADALVRTQVAARASARFWTLERRRALDLQRPDASIPSRLGHALRQSTTDTAASRDLMKSMLQPTNMTDTHPGLAERLAALGVTPRPLNPPDNDAAEAFLGDLAPVLEAELGAALARTLRQEWIQLRQDLHESAARLDALDGQIAGGRLDPQAVVERAGLIEQIRGPDPALDAWRVALSVNPGLRLARFHLGRLELEVRDDEAGLALLEGVCAEDPKALVEAAQVTIPWLRSQDRATEAEDWLQRARAQLDVLNAEHRQTASRAGFEKGDTLLPATLSEDEMRALIETLRSSVGVLQAIVADKAGSIDDTGEPLRVLFLRMSAADAHDRSEAFSAVVGWFDLPGRWHFIAEDAPRWMWRAARKLGEDAILPV